MIGTWVLYIPFVKKKLALNDSQIGFALFCLALGILSLLPLIPYLIKKLRLGRLTFFAIVLFAIAFTLPVIMPNYKTLCMSLFIVGLFSGATDISMNALVTEIEKKDQVNIMSSAHGFFSLGGGLGAILGSFLMPFFKLPIYHMIATALLIIFINTLLVKHYFYITEKQPPKEKNTYSFKKIKPILALAFIAFVIMCSEGAIEHWSSLYLIEIVKVKQPNFAGLGFILFSIMMTIGRFFGDGISSKIGSLKIIILGCMFASLGYLFVLFGQLIISLLGFGIIGLGLSVIIPELFRIAGKIKKVKTSVGISIISGIGFVGFLIGPISLGYVSNNYNLKISFLILLALTCITLLLVFLKLKKN